MEYNQRSQFLNSEADEWFLRNRHSSKPQVPIDISHIFSSLSYKKNDITRILEIGCADGSKTNQLADFFDAESYGIDPSTLAIQHADSNSLGNTYFKVATADNLPFEPNKFDVVYFAFCLYLVDRSLIFQAISEADRVLKPGGHIVITDFDAISPSKTPYHHKEGVMTYRNNYANFFLSTAHYSLVSKISYSHSNEFFETDVKERVSTQVLYKELDPYAEN
jgi:ubiquinone/menaquinone biosynthesis C-methylase UbiE